MKPVYPRNTSINVGGKIIGIFLIVTALFLIVSLFLHQRGDNAIIENVSVFSVFTEVGQLVRSLVSHKLGFLGAKSSAFFITSFFGYTSSLLLGVMVYWGIVAIRRKNYARAGYHTLYAFLLSIAFATVFGFMKSPFGGALAGGLGSFFSSELIARVGFSWGLFFSLLMLATLFLLIFGKKFFPLISSKITGKSGRENLDVQPEDEERVLENKTSHLKDIDGGFAASSVSQDQEVVDKTKTGGRESIERGEVMESNKEKVEYKSKPSDRKENPESSSQEEHLSSQEFIHIQEQDKKKEKNHEARNQDSSEENIAMILNDSIYEQVANLDDRDDLPEGSREGAPYDFPSVSLLDESKGMQETVTEKELKDKKIKLVEKLRIYNIAVIRIEATIGPRVTLFELELDPSVKVSRIVSLQDDIAMAMEAKAIRILAPIPGKNAVGIEIPNNVANAVRIKTVLNTEKFKNTTYALPLVFGKTISNEVFIDDLAKMPHLLIAGATGSGKSVGINTIITSLLYHCSPYALKFALIDPKRVELFPYRCLRDHFLVKYSDIDEQIITDTSKSVYALKSIEKEMDDRYELLAKRGVRDISSYNQKNLDDKMVYIVVIIDELADMMITAGRDVEEPIARLAQLARAVGIHLVIATQRPSVNVITGVIKANFPARISYQVASSIDSRTILDTMGAEQLLGNGDMLYLSPSQAKPIRVQNAYVSIEEVERLTSFIESQPSTGAYELSAPEISQPKRNKLQRNADRSSKEARDVMFEEAAHLVVQNKQGSVSFLQRRLKLGFGRAARIMDQLENASIVGPSDGSKPREVLVESEDELNILLR